MVTIVKVVLVSLPTCSIVTIPKVTIPPQIVTAVLAGRSQAHNGLMKPVVTCGLVTFVVTVLFFVTDIMSSGDGGIDAVTVAITVAVTIAITDAFTILIFGRTVVHV